jgi:UBA/TS-N domain
MLGGMGYDREQSVYALKISNNNLDYACNYLLNNPNPIPIRAAAINTSSMRASLSNIFSNRNI